MSVKPHKGRRTRSKGRGQTDRFAVKSTGAGAGAPNFLNKPKPQKADIASPSEKEARSKSIGDVKERPVETPLGKSAAQSLSQEPDRGRKLSRSERSDAERKRGMDFSDVSVTPNSQIAASYGANAMTFGKQIHTAGPTIGPELLDHELAHVAQQQKFGSCAAQFDLHITNSEDADSGLGLFEFDFVSRLDPSDGQTGLDGDIKFHPHAHSPYSNRIGLIQTADVEELNRPGTPDVDWSGTDEANREHVKTSEGSFVDTLHADLGAQRNEEPWYWQDEKTTNNDTDPHNHFGWNRGPKDIKETALYDFPGTTGTDRFKFETVAKGRDNNVVYGAVRWGFDVIGSNITANEWVEVTKSSSSGVAGQPSANFNEALREFRDFYVHEPQIIYFGYDQDLPEDGELAKLADVPNYMTEYPNVMIELSASADTRGSRGYNRRLSLRRMNAVHTALLSLGVPESRIRRNEAAAGESSAQGSQDANLKNTEGSYRANRRVTVTFLNTVSRPP